MDSSRYIYNVQYFIDKIDVILLEVQLNADNYFIRIVESVSDLAMVDIYVSINIIVR